MAGWVKKKEKRGKTNRGQHIHHTCKYTNYTEQSKLELSGLVGSKVIRKSFQDNVDVFMVTI